MSVIRLLAWVAKASSKSGPVDIKIVVVARRRWDLMVAIGTSVLTVALSQTSGANVIRTEQLNGVNWPLRCSQV
jgi:hypothetical protein